MRDDCDSSASGYLNDSFEGISRQFTDVEILSTSATNIVARAKRYGRWWTLKGLSPEVAHEEAYRQRQRKEFELLIGLQHPSVVAAVGLEPVDGLGDCIVMEYVEGVTLSQWLKLRHPLKERRRLAHETMRAVGYIHSKGIIHRDLKPDNIIVTANGNNAKLIDFGLADTDSHTVLKQPAGTRRYMSPEQMQTATADVRNDIYSLGVIFRQMRLGYGRVAARCLQPIDRRYSNIAELTDAIARRHCVKTLTVWLAVAVVIAALALTALSLAQRLGELSSQTAASQQGQDSVRTAVATLGDTLHTLAAGQQTLQDTQRSQEASRQKVAAAVARGKAAIDKAIADAGIAHHLDTLSNLAWLRPDLLAKLHDGDQAVNRFVEDLGADYTASETTQIADALEQYSADRTQDIINTYTKLKEAHDKATMPGH